MTTENLREIAVFGGTFNPPTLAHQAIIGACLEHPAFDEVWVMPSGDRTDKDITVPATDRIAMLEAVKAEVFENTDRLHITDIELQLPAPTETIKTVNTLRTVYTGIRFWMVYGADSYAAMPTWRGGEELQRTVPMLVLPREGYELPAESARIKHLPLTDPELLGMSSTRVREAAEQQKPFADLVCNAVKAYIDAFRLYQPQEGAAL